MKNLDETTEFNSALILVASSAQSRTGGGNVCRDFLLALYNSVYQFEIMRLRLLDEEHVEACLTIMRVYFDSHTSQEIHEFFDNGDALFRKFKEERLFEQS